ncbi:TPA: hypothetical protein ACYLN4_001093 [Burkholderia lata]
MSYKRVIPRDLFNEASLLKGCGRIYINLETAGVPDVVMEHDGAAFDIQQDFGSGDIYVSNVQLKVKGKGYRLYRRLNSREAWPLYIIDENGEEIAVFADDGSFSSEMTDFLRGDKG